MHKFFISLTTLLTALTSVALLAACNDTTRASVAEIVSNDSIPVPVKGLVTAVADNDAVRFSRLISYPLSRPYPLHDISDSIQMRNYYTTLVDDSLKNAITLSKPAAWQSYGWRGWTLDNGRYVWIDEQIYDIPYLSKREKTLRDSLITAEIKTLPLNLRSGFTPIACLQSTDTKTVYRIDAATSTATPRDKAYRLCIYPNGKNLKQQPRQIFYGQKTVEGTAATTTYIFQTSERANIIYAADISDDSAPAIITEHHNGSTTTQTVTPTYWLTLLPPH